MLTRQESIGLNIQMGKFIYWNVI